MDPHAARTRRACEKVAQAARRRAPGVAARARRGKICRALTQRAAESAVILRPPSEPVPLAAFLAPRAPHPPHALAQMGKTKNAVVEEEPVIDKKAVKARPPGGRCAPAARRARPAPAASSVQGAARARRSGAAARRALGAASNRQTLGTSLSGQPRARAARLSPPFPPRRASAHLWARGAQPQQRLHALRAPHSQRPR